MWLRGILAARWFPYVLTGCLAVVIAVFGYGYSRGYGSAEATYTEAMNRALADQYERMLAQAEVEQKIAMDAQRKKYEIRLRVSKVQRPTVSCDLAPECMQWFDDVLLKASPDINEPD